MRKVAAFWLAPLPTMLLLVLAISVNSGRHNLIATFVGGIVVCWILQLVIGVPIAVAARRVRAHRWWQWAVIGAATYGLPATAYVGVRGAPIVVIVGVGLFLALLGALAGVTAWQVGREIPGDQSADLQALRHTFD